MSWRPLFLSFIAVELLSLTAYFFPWLNAAGFVVLISAALILSIKRLEYGLYFVLAELILGGKGYLFSANLGGTEISLRMGLFVVVMAVWIGKMVVHRLHNPSSPPLILRRGNWKILKWWGLLGATVIWGLIIGFLRGNDFSNLFLDANGYFYAVMILPFMWIFYPRHPEEWDDEGSPASVGTHTCEISHFVRNDKLNCFFMVLLTATAWLAIKTLLVVYFFTHVNNIFFAANLESFYRWVRDTGVGEITWLPGNFARVFFQSHIYNIAALFFLLITLISHSHIPSKGGQAHNVRMKIYTWLLLALNFAVIIISLSRSFWVGVIIGFVVVMYFAWRQHYLKRLSSTIFITLALAGLMLIIVARFPLPRPSVLDLSATTKSRLEFESAASSRWNLLPPLWQTIKKHPILGNGLGTTVTYISHDPRVREQDPTGKYTTYAFEWGWLDLWLKFGLLGIAAYLLLLYQLARHFWQTKNEALSIASLAIIFSLAAIHFFTPYLNHPLGFGLLILLTIICLKHSPKISDIPAEIPAHS